jgi:hypothetical protein
MLSGEAPANSDDVSDTFRVSAVAAGDAACVAIAPTGYIDTASVPSATRLLFCDARGIGAIGDSNVSVARGVVIDPNARARVTREADVIAGWGLGCP